MPFRNPFKRDNAPEFVKPALSAGEFQDASLTGAKPIDIVVEPVEYKLSEIDDSGAFLPPTPTEKSVSIFWSRTNSTITSASTISDSEPFSMSRESFDSYRRSFDISARSPVVSVFSEFDEPSRHSLDSRSASINKLRLRHDHSAEWPREGSEDTEFEDVTLNEDANKPATLPQKKSFFARLADRTEHDQHEPKTPTNHHNFLFAGRKRAQSGQGSELKSMPRPIGRSPVAEVIAES